MPFYADEEEMLADFASGPSHSVKKKKPGLVNRYDVDFGPAEIQPQYDVDFGPAEIQPQYDVDFGPAEVERIPGEPALGKPGVTVNLRRDDAPPLYITKRPGEGYPTQGELRELAQKRDQRERWQGMPNRPQYITKRPGEGYPTREELQELARRRDESRAARATPAPAAPSTTLTVPRWGQVRYPDDPRRLHEAIMRKRSMEEHLAGRGNQQQNVDLYPEEFSQFFRGLVR